MAPPAEEPRPRDKPGAKTSDGTTTDSDPYATEYAICAFEDTNQATTTATSPTSTCARTIFQDGERLVPLAPLLRFLRSQGLEIGFVNLSFGLGRLVIVHVVTLLLQTKTLTKLLIISRNPNGSIAPALFLSIRGGRRMHCRSPTNGPPTGLDRRLRRALTPAFFRVHPGTDLQFSILALH